MSKNSLFSGYLTKNLCSYLSNVNVFNFIKNNKDNFLLFFSIFILCTYFNSINTVKAYAVITEQKQAKIQSLISYHVLFMKRIYTHLSDSDEKVKLQHIIQTIRSDSDSVDPKLIRDWVTIFHHYLERTDPLKTDTTLQSAYRQLVSALVRHNIHVETYNDYIQLFFVQKYHFNKIILPKKIISHDLLDRSKFEIIL